MSRSVSLGSEEEVGNTRTSSRVSTSLYWSFTLNNHTDEQFEILKKEICLHCIDYRVQEEIGESGTRHLQGYIQARKRIRPMETFSEKSIHWEKCRSPKHARAYCCKDDSATGNFVLDTEEQIVLIKPDRPWQLEILELIKKPPTRKIHWYWESIGGVGKTTVTRWLVGKHDALVVSGKSDNCKYAITQYKEKKKIYPKIIVWNIPRSLTKEYVNYEAIETIEDGVFFSGKYESGSVLMNHPHIILFANVPPETHKMSIRKWNIVEIKMSQPEEDSKTQLETQVSMSQIYSELQHLD